MPTNETQPRETCKRCLRPYVRPFKMNISFSFDEMTIGWEGCADCAHAIRRQMVDFLLRAAKPPRKVQIKIDRNRQ